MQVAQKALYEAIEEYLQADCFDDAKAALAEAPESDEFQVLHIKLGLLSGGLAPDVAMQKLIQLMRQKPELLGAKTLYQEASRLAYSGRESSVAHSHPPPPVRSNEPKR
jgi:hypothetical protein